jgi:hypothetical protein
MDYQSQIAQYKEMQQSPFELAAFCKWIEEARVSSYLEIGLRSGETFTYLSKTFGFVSPCGMELYRGKVHSLPKDAKVYYGDCRGAAALEWVAQYAPFDLIFIDGSHIYDHVKMDYELYRDFGRYIAFHDILWTPGGVKQLWEELQEDNKVIFQVANPNHPYGIGVIKGTI